MLPMTTTHTPLSAIEAGDPLSGVELDVLAALIEYANPLNWNEDPQGIRRVWLEPGSTTPAAYNGFELAAKAMLGSRDCCGANADEIHMLKAELDTVRRLLTEYEGMKSFARDVLNIWPNDADGATLQELGEKHGLLIPTMMHAPCCEEGCACADVCDDADFKSGIECFRKCAAISNQQSEDQS